MRRNNNEIKTGDKILVPFEVLDVQDSGDYPYFLGYDTARLHASAEMLEQFQQEAGGEDSGKTYEDGLREAWEMAKKMFLYPHEGGYNSEELEEIFGRTEHLWELTPQEAAAKISEWESEKELHVGDIVTNCFGSKYVVTGIDGQRETDTVYILRADGFATTVYKIELTKTGRTIDIAALLAQIGGKENV